MSDEIPWSIGSLKPFRVIHRSTCRYGRRPWVWGGDRTEDQLVTDILMNGPLSIWANAGCKYCCPRLKAALRGARAVTPDPYNKRRAAS